MLANPTSELRRNHEREHELFLIVLGKFAKLSFEEDLGVGSDVEQRLLTDGTVVLEKLSGELFQNYTDLSFLQIFAHCIVTLLSLPHIRDELQELSCLVLFLLNWKNQACSRIRVLKATGVRLT